MIRTTKQISTIHFVLQVKRRSTAYIHLIQHQLTRKSLMTSVGTATVTVLVRKKGKVLSSLYRIGIKMEYLASYKWQLQGAGTSRFQTYRTSCWSGWPREFGTLNPNPHSEYSPRLFSYFFATFPTPVTYIYTLSLFKHDKF